jgi:YD repeat-containing protein
MQFTTGNLTRTLALVFLTGVAMPLLAHVPQHSGCDIFTRRLFAHDPLGRRTAAIKPSGATDAFGYDGLGNWTTYTNAEGRVYTMAYDALGRLVAATNALGHQVFANLYDPAGNLTNHTDGAGHTIAYSYDVLNRLVRRESGVGGSASSFAHDPVGNLLTASNSTATLAFGYDIMDRLASATTTVSGVSFVASYSRDAGGLVTNVVFGRAGATTPPSIARAYDPDGRLVAVSDWHGRTWTFAWDGAGKPTGGTAPGGIVATNHYDAAGRLASWSVGSLAGRAITRDLAGLKTRDEIAAGPHPVRPSYATQLHRLPKSRRVSSRRSAAWAGRPALACRRQSRDRLRECSAWQGPRHDRVRFRRTRLRQCQCEFRRIPLRFRALNRRPWQARRGSPS